MTLRSLKFIPSIDITFLSKVLELLIPASNCFWVMNAFVKKVIFATDIFWKVTLMTVALAIIGNYYFFLLFPLYFFEIYNFELISFFRFRLPYTGSGNPFGLCRDLWAYSVEGIPKCEILFIGKVALDIFCNTNGDENQFKRHFQKFPKVFGYLSSILHFNWYAASVFVW